MHAKTNASSRKNNGSTNQEQPVLEVRKLGVVARDYNKSKDFRSVLPEVLKVLDQKGCDTVLFSSFSLKTELDPEKTLGGLKNIKAVFLEMFSEKLDKESMPQKKKKVGKIYIVYYRTGSDWKKYRLEQWFGSLSDVKKEKVHRFVRDEMPKRTLGNCFLLLCGESNGVKYHKDDKKIHDDFNLRKEIPEEVKIILNPCHDYTVTRYQPVDFNWLRVLCTRSTVQKDKTIL